MTRDTNDLVAQYKPRLLHGIRRGFGDYYDRLGLTAAGSLVLASAIFLGMAIASVFHQIFQLPVAIVASVTAFWFLATYAWAGNVLVAHRIAYFEDPSLRSYVDILKEYGVGLLKLAGVELVVSAIMVMDAIFFLAQSSSALKIVGTIVTYMLLLWFMTMVWHWPFFITENRATLKILKKSALVAVDNPLLSLEALVACVLCGALAATGIAIPFVIGGLASCIQVRLHRECLKKYGFVEDEPEEIDNAGWPTASGPPHRLHPRRPG